MTDSFMPDDDLDDVSYEDFDDMLWDEADELEVIDLDALDEAIPGEFAPDGTAIALDDATSDLLDSLEDAISPESDTSPAAPDPTPEISPSAMVETLDAMADEPDADEEDMPIAHSVESLLDILDDALDVPPIATPPEKAATPPALMNVPREDAPDALDTTPTSEIDQQADAPLVPAPFTAVDPVYQVLIALPADLGAQVLELRETGAIEDMPPPGIVLTPRFRTPDRPALVDAINAWIRRHLPVQLEITTVHAEVIGSQHYVAAWRIQPEAVLRQLLAHLRQALTGQITPLPNASAAVHLRVTIGDGIPATRFPRVVAQMQREFEPYVWQAQTVVLAGCDAAAEQPEWSVVAVLDGSSPHQATPSDPNSQTHHRA